MNVDGVGTLYVIEQTYRRESTETFGTNLDFANESGEIIVYGFYDGDATFFSPRYSNSHAQGMTARARAMCAAEDELATSRSSSRRPRAHASRVGEGGTARGRLVYRATA